MVMVMMMTWICSTDHAQGFFQNLISDFHAADCLIKQFCQLMMPFLPGELRPLPKVFSVMKIVFNPVG